MGSKARRTALSVAGLALAGGASLGLAAPASATTPAGDDHGSGSVDVSFGQESASAGSYKRVVTEEVAWNTQEKSDGYAHVAVDQGGRSTGCDTGCAEDDHGHAVAWYAGYKEKGGYRERLAGFNRSYRACRAAGLRGERRGWWDDFDCDFTRRGYRGWHQSWNKWSSHDWRCRGVWVLRVQG